MARTAASLLVTAALLSPAAAQCNCTTSVVGAVLGTFFGTLLLGAAVLLILWFCCLRQRLHRKAAASETTYQVPENPPTVALHDMHSHAHRDSLWGVPSALKKFLKKCSIPPESVHQVRLERNPNGDTLDFSVGSRGVGLFLKDIDSKSELSHIHHLEEGAHVIGVSVAFDSWPAPAAAEFLSRAAPFGPQLHVRCTPLFQVDSLQGCPVLSGPPVSEPEGLQFPEPREEVEEEEELMTAECAKTVQSARALELDSRPSSTDFESVDLSDEHPAELRLSGTLTYDRSNEVQPERILIVRSSMEVRSDDSTTCSSRGSPAPPGFDVYRATPVHLGPESEFDEYDIEVTEAPALQDLRLASPLDSGFSTSAFANNGGSSNGARGLSSSEASQDVPEVGFAPGAGYEHEIGFENRRGPENGFFHENGFDPKAGFGSMTREARFDVTDDCDHEDDLNHAARFSLHSSRSSTPTSVVEEAIERSSNPRVQLARRRSPEAHPELSELDRKIALNNIEIATLMLNDSHERLALREARCSESEPESAHEDQILPTAREQTAPSFVEKLRQLEDVNCNTCA